MNIKKNVNKGFTLIELLVIIVIIGIISATIIISMSNIFKKNRTNFYKSQEDMILLATKNYVEDYKNQLPREVGKIKKIYLSQLNDKDYISKILDYKKNSCNLEKSYVIIRKSSKTKYEYSTYLECDDYTSSEVNNPTGNIEIIFNNNISQNQPIITTTIKDLNNVGIASYEYRVIKNNLEYINSHNTKNTNKDITQDINFIIDFNKYRLPSGNYTLIVNAYDKFGNRIQKKLDNIEIKNSDTEAKCGSYVVNDLAEDNTIVRSLTNNQNIDWIKGKRSVIINCEGTNCTTPTAIKEYTHNESINLDTIKLNTSDGIETICPVIVKLDNTPPTTPKAKYVIKGTTNKYETNNWINKDIQANLYGSYDKHSKEVYYEYYTSSVNITADSYFEEYKVKGNSTQFTTEGEKYYLYRACDKVGNCTNLKSDTIKIDKKAPTCSVAYSGGVKGLNGWYKSGTSKTNPVVATGTCKDTGGSGCTKSEVEIATRYRDGTFNASKIIEDNAGNKQICNASFNIDTTPPYIQNDTIKLHRKDSPFAANEGTNCGKWKTGFNWRFTFYTKDAGSGLSQMHIILTDNSTTYDAGSNIHFGTDYNQTICVYDNTIEIAAIGLKDEAGNCTVMKKLNPSEFTKPTSQTEDKKLKYTKMESSACSWQYFNNN